MKYLLLLAVVLCAAQSWATPYFISPTGSDGNSGLSSGLPWLSPNHALNCGDTLSAAVGTYSTANFQSGKWGTVTCPGSNDVAWLICATFDACKITSTTTSAMHLDKSYWGVVGWEVTTTTNTSASGFQIEPATSTLIHHIIIANNVINGAVNGGISAYNNGTTGGNDYLVLIGNVVYNAASTSAVCASGINIYEPIASDTNAGTHMYVAGNISYSNLDPNPCNGGGPTDGEGIILDTFDGHQQGTPVYKQQAVLQNNLSLNNGGRGIQVEYNNVTSPLNATIFVKFNTAYGNMQDPNQAFLGLGEMTLQSASNTTFSNNLTATKAATDPAGQTVYGFAVTSPDTTDTVATNWIFGVGGFNTFSFNASGFTYGSNSTGTSPAFVGTTIPGAPSCTGTGNVPTCMATAISNFTPTTGGATAFGRQTVSNTSVSDTLFPQWLCTSTATLNANIPLGIITPGCGVAGVTANSYLNSGTLKGATIH